MMRSVKPDTRIEPERAKPLPRREGATIEVRHLGGEVKSIEVFDATDDGALHVRWPEGAGTYVLHLFRTVERRGSGLLYRTVRSRHPLHWQVADLEKGRSLWRQWTGRERATEWRKEWKDGRFRFVKV